MIMHPTAQLLPTPAHPGNGDPIVMRMIASAAAALLLAAAPAVAQEQQAGNAASANADATFQKLIDQCDDVDTLVLRARVRLLIGRTTAAAAQQAQTLMTQGLAKCGEGDIDGAKQTLQQAYDIADAGATERFGQDATPDLAADKAVAATDAAAETAKEDKPWWKVW